MDNNDDNRSNVDAEDEQTKDGTMVLNPGNEIDLDPPADAIGKQRTKLQQQGDPDPPLRKRLTRSAAIAVRAARDQIVRASGSLASRIAEARELLESDLTVGSAQQHVNHFVAMETGLREMSEIFQGHYDRALEAVGTAEQEQQDVLYDSVTGALSARTATVLRLRENPTPAEVLQIAAEHVADLRMIRQQVEDEQREELERSSIGGSDFTSVSQKRGTDPPPQAVTVANNEQRRTRYQTGRNQNATKDETANDSQRVITPVLLNARSIFQRRQQLSPIPIGDLRINDWPQPQRAWEGRAPLEPTRHHTQRHHSRESPSRQHHSRPREGATTFETVRLQPPTFSGKPEDWTTFWAYFQRAVDDRAIPAFEKQLHLLRCLKEGSPARRAVEVYRPSDGNYPVVVRLLKERFGDTDDLQRAIRAQLLHLSPAKDNVLSLTTVVDEFERGVSQLEQLGANVDDGSFGPLLEAKLPVRILTELRIRESMMGVKWSVRDFRKAVTGHVKCMRAAESALAAMREPERRQEPRREAVRMGHGAGQGREDFKRAFMVRDNPGGNRGPPGPRPGMGRGANQPERVEEQKNVQVGSYSRQPDAAPRLNEGRHDGMPSGCSLCGRTGHQPSQCTKYGSAQARRQRLLEQHRCLKCLASTHTANQCQRGIGCRWCQQTDHHWLICWKGAPNRSETEAVQQPNRVMMTQKMTLGGRGTPRAAENSRPNQQSRGPDPGGHPPGADAQRAFTTVGRQHPAYLMLCPVVMTAEDGGSECRAVMLLDPASHVDCVDAGLISQLKPKKIGSEMLKLQVFGGKETKTPSARYNVKLKRTDGGWEDLEVSSVDKICTPIRTEFARSGATPERLHTMTVTVQPQLLVGIRRFWDFVQGFRQADDGTYLIDTVFGTVMCGERFQASTGVTPDPSVMVIGPCGDDEKEQMPAVKAVEQIWSVEAIGITDNPSDDADAEAVIQFERSVRQQEDGRYSIRLPWREEYPELPSNYAVAYRRLIGLLQRLQRTPEILKKYQQVIEEQFENGVIEKATIGTGKREYFIPHQAVITPKKLRVVYDASAHAKGVPSLNDCLLRGPVWLPDLAGMLIRFRACQVPVIADVEKAFLMVGIEEEDREVSKFLWVRDPFGPITTANLVPYRFRRLAFGLTPSPFCLAAVVRHHLRKYDTEFAEELIRDTYVDNVLIPADSVDEAAQKATKAKEMFTAAKMNLREFLSNDDGLNNSFPEADALGKTTAKMLGLEWDAVRDVVRIVFPGVTPEGGCSNSRRTVLKTIASLFDPLGLLAPATLPAKQFFQRLWETTHSWDAMLETDDIREWNRILASWEGEVISIPRGVRANGPLPGQLHVYCDASVVAYAAAAYIRSEEPDGRIRSRLVMAKSRLKPKKAAETFTIPRMELMGLLLGVRLAAFVKKQLHRPIAGEHIWSDSMIALHWIKGRAAQPQFIANRLAEIRRATTTTFHYVRTDENPADVATRGLSPAQLQQSVLWWNGPEWLTSSEETWPMELTFGIDGDDQTPSPGEGDAEIALLTREEGTPEEEEKEWTTTVLYRSSSWIKALRISAWVLRFLRALRGQKRKRLEREEPPLPGEGGIEPPRFEVEVMAKRLPALRSDELLRSKEVIIQAVQREILPPKGVLTEIDPDGLRRITSRIGQCAEPEISRPIILPRKSRAGALIMDDIHERLHHSGVIGTLAEFLRGWWTPSARRQARRVINQCRKCRKMQGAPFSLPPMPPLPADRVRRRLPFESVGLDYLGPTAILDDNGQRKKAWVLLITCLTTRAIYIEATRDLSAQSFIGVLRRFIARRGAPSRILSDNAPTFTVVGKALAEFGITGTDPIGFADSRGIRWRFTPQHTPWAGGIFERLVQLVKRALQKTLGGAVISYDSFATLLAEIEATVNSRPLTYVNTAAGDPHPLRPIDLIQENNRLRADPPEVPEQHGRQKDPPHIQLIRQWRDSQQRLDHFWKRWHREYLMTLREKAKWTHPRRRVIAPGAPKIGDVVLIEDKFHPRNLWAMGRVVEIRGSADQIRSVLISMPNGRVWGRPVNKICPVEEAPPDDQEEEPPDEAVQDPGTMIRQPVEEEADEGREESTPCPNDSETETEAPQEDEDGLAEGQEVQAVQPPGGATEAPEVLPEDESGRAREAEDKSITTSGEVQAVQPEVRPARGVRQSKRDRRAREVWSPEQPAPRKRRNGLGMLTLFMCIAGAFGCQPAIRTAPFESELPAATTGEAPCAMQCAARGVTMISNRPLSKVEICCPDGCWATTPNAAEANYELPAELLIHGYHCNGQCWWGTAPPHNVTQRCPARTECALIDCSFCWEQMANPTCNPRWVSTLFGFGAAVLLAILGCICPILGRFWSGATLFSAAVAWGVGYPIRLINWATGRNTPSPTTEQIERKVQKGTRMAQTELRELQRRLQLGRRARAAAQAWKQPERGRGIPPGREIMALLPLLLIIGTAAGSKPLAVMVRSEDCARSAAGLKCAGSAATVLTLLPSDQINSFIIRTPQDELLGAVRLRLASITMVCVPKTEHWLRSYSISTTAVKRCPSAGSCQGSTCSSVRNGGSVPELVSLNHRPGHSFCLRSTSFWQNACGLPTAACLFYRWAAVPTTTTVFEEFTCLEWDLQISAWVELETNNGKVESHRLTIHPGVPEEWGNMTISVIPTSLPPIPVLSSHFITDGRAVAMGKPIPSDLHCPDEETARGFDQCQLSIGACQKCAPDHDNGTVHCHCRDLDIGRVINDPEHRLPMDVARLHLHNDGPNVRAEFHYAPVQVHVQLHGLELVSEYSNTKCWVMSPTLSGCYRCKSGATLNATCRTDHGTALAKVKCADGTLFALHCGGNDSTTTEAIPFDRAEVFTECQVKCPAGITTFRLKGELVFIPKQQRFGFSSRDSSGGLIDPGSGFHLPDWHIDPFPLLHLLTSGPWLLMALGAATIGLAALYLFIKFNPHFRLYKLLMALLTLSVVGGSPTAEHLGKAPRILPLEIRTSSVPIWEGEMSPALIGLIFFACGAFGILCRLLINRNRQIYPIRPLPLVIAALYLLAAEWATADSNNQRKCLENAAGATGREQQSNQSASTTNGGEEGKGGGATNERRLPPATDQYKRPRQQQKKSFLSAFDCGETTPPAPVPPAPPFAHFISFFQLSFINFTIMVFNGFGCQRYGRGPGARAGHWDRPRSPTESNGDERQSRGSTAGNGPLPRGGSAPGRGGERRSILGAPRPLPRQDIDGTVAEEVEELNVPNWPTDPWMRAIVENHLRQKEAKGWRMVHLRSGEIAPRPFVLGLVASDQQLICPNWTVSRYFSDHRDQPLRHRDWPGVYTPGGVVGTSRRSLQRQRARGMPPWRAGHVHVDWLPMEAIQWKTQAELDREAMEEMDGAPMDQNQLERAEQNTAEPARGVPPLPNPPLREMGSLSEEWTMDAGWGEDEDDDNAQSASDKNNAVPIQKGTEGQNVTPSQAKGNENFANGGFGPPHRRAVPMNTCPPLSTQMGGENGPGQNGDDQQKMNQSLFKSAGNGSYSLTSNPLNPAMERIRLNSDFSDNSEMRPNSSSSSSSSHATARRDRRRARAVERVAAELSAAFDLHQQLNNGAVMYYADQLARLGRGDQQRIRQRHPNLPSPCRQRPENDRPQRAVASVVVRPTPRGPRGDQRRGSPPPEVLGCQAGSSGWRARVVPPARQNDVAAMTEQAEALKRDKAEAEVELQKSAARVVQAIKKSEEAEKKLREERRKMAEEEKKAKEVKLKQLEEQAEELRGMVNEARWPAPTVEKRRVKHPQKVGGTSPPPSPPGKLVIDDSVSICDEEMPDERARGAPGSVAKSVAKFGDERRDPPLLVFGADGGAHEASTDEEDDFGGGIVRHPLNPKKNPKGQGRDRKSGWRR